MRTPMEHTGFPSDETLAAFIDGRLDEETRERVVEHLGKCSECQDVWLQAVDCNHHVNMVPTLVSSRLRRHSWFIAASLAAAIVVLITVSPVRQHLARYDLDR